MIFWNPPTFLQYVAYFGLSALGCFICDVFWTFHLVLLAFKSPSLMSMLMGFYSRLRGIIVTLLLICLICYCYSIIGFVFFHDHFYSDSKPSCTNLLECTVMVLNYGLRSPGGIGDVLTTVAWGNSLFWWRFLYDLSFYVIILVMLLNVILGIVVDTFVEIRQASSHIFAHIRICWITPLVMLTFTLIIMYLFCWTVSLFIMITLLEGHRCLWKKVFDRMLHLWFTKKQIWGNSCHGI